MGDSDKNQKTTISPIYAFIAGVLIATIAFLAWEWLEEPIVVDTVAPPNTSCGPQPASDDRGGLRIGNNGQRTDQTTDSIFKPVREFGRVSRDFIANSSDMVGGSISKCDLQAIINSMDKTQLYVDYLFGLDTLNHRALLILKGGKVNPASTNGELLGQPLIYRTGTMADSYCPVRCGDGSWER